MAPASLQATDLEQPGRFNSVQRGVSTTGMFHAQHARDRRPSPDSWIEITSQPSSSSLSSAADDIAGTDLSKQYGSHTRRRRRTMQGVPFYLDLTDRPPSVNDSSQEEYEESESESESDRLMTSSNEEIPRDSTTLPSEPSGPTLEGQSDNENVLAQERSSTQQCFTPQPNAFSHPPSSQIRMPEPVPGSYFPPHGPPIRSGSQRQSYATQDTRQSHLPYNIISPSAQADHDAALRASLSTLLSVAAAARGLPKSAQVAAIRPQPAASRVEPSTLRLVPESDIPARKQTSAPRRTSITSNTSSQASATAQDKGKRKAAARSTSKDRRATKKPRRILIDETISPTLLTWVVSAGVLVLVSALSFSAGYAVGRESGAAEVGANSVLRAGEGASCGKELSRSGMGLRRLRWGGGGSAVKV